MNKIELFSREVEENVLGCLIVFEECKSYIQLLEEKDFEIEINKYIFRLIKKLDEGQKPIDLVSIKEKAKQEKLNAKQIFNKCIDLTNIAITSTRIDFYIQKLKNYSTKRELEQRAKDILQLVYEEHIEIDATEMKKECLEKIASIKTEKLKNDKDTMLSVMTETVEDIEKRFRNKSDNKYKTGFFDLDKATEGLHEQEFTIIAARPGCGKTSFALNIAENLARKNVYTLFVSLEMSKKQLGNRLIAGRTRIDSHKLRSGWLEEKDFAKVGEAAAEFTELKMLIDDRSTTIQEIEAEAIYLKQKKNIGLIIIDYLQLLKSKNKFSIREQEVAEISRKIKLLSKELDIPIIALCQLNREATKRNRPVLADLRESGSLEQDADNVIFLYLDEAEKEKAVMETEVIVAKQRNGPVGTIKLKFDKKIMKFCNVVR